MAAFEFPDGKKFAFTVLDDTDVATVENVKPVYDLFYQLKMRTTKTVWPVSCPEGSKYYSSSQTMEDEDYLEFVKDLQRKGFEITWHGATMESSARERSVDALNKFKEQMGSFPHIHVNHSSNRENIYWGAERINQTILRYLYKKTIKVDDGYYSGHKENSPYWWGDYCSEHIKYARNLTFNNVNIAKVNPSMPYRDPLRPLVPWWFSTSDADDIDEFNELLSSKNQQKLEDEGGICIVSTHLGKGYVQDGFVNPEARRHLEELAQRPGWFPTVGELLDWLREQRKTDELPLFESISMEWKWAFDLCIRKLKERKRKLAS